jgi:hypothetical protein
MGVETPHRLAKPRCGFPYSCPMIEWWEPPHLCGGKSALALCERGLTLFTRFSAGKAHYTDTLIVTISHGRMASFKVPSSTGFIASSFSSIKFVLHASRILFDN